MNVLLPFQIVAAAVIMLGGTWASAAEATPPPVRLPADDGYRLNLQDKLLFSVVEDPINGSAPEEIYVNALGEIHPRISRGFAESLSIDARGKTLAEVRLELKALLEASYYQKATVELRLVEQTKKSGQVLFFGAVRANFLSLPAGEKRTIFEGVYQVGVSEFANLKKVKLSRVNPATGKVESQTIDLEAIKKGNRALDVPLQDGDRVEVSEKKIVF